MIVKNLISCILMSGTIATGGIQSDMDTASFNNVPKNNSQINGTIRYELKLQYDENYSLIYYSKYEAKQTINTLYSNINSYQYNYFAYMDSLVPNTMLNGWRILNFIGADFYEAIISKDIRINYTVDITNLVISNANQSIYDVNIYRITNEEYNQNANKTNLNYILNYQIQGTLLNTTTDNYQNISTIDIDISPYIRDNVKNEYLIIELRPNDSGSGIGPVNNSRPNDPIIPTSITYNYIARDVNYEVVDIPTLIFTIITLPFSFISQAFMPITLFPNTPYAINIGNLIIVGLTVLIVIFIIKKFRK